MHPGIRICSPDEHRFHHSSLLYSGERFFARTLAAILHSGERCGVRGICGHALLAWLRRSDSLFATGASLRGLRGRHPNCYPDCQAGCSLACSRRTFEVRQTVGREQLGRRNGTPGEVRENLALQKARSGAVSPRPGRGSFPALLWRGAPCNRRIRSPSCRGPPRGRRCFR